MKVLRKSESLPLLEFECSCPHCDALLQVEESDIVYMDDSGFGYAPFATCGDCSERFRVRHPIPPRYERRIRNRRATDIKPLPPPQRRRHPAIIQDPAGGPSAA